MNNPGPAIINYEVYTFDGQRWTLHARFQRKERDEALEEAKQVERSLFMGCKVVRETYYPGNNTSEEAVIYMSERALLKASKPLPRSVPRRAYVASPSTAGSSVAIVSLATKSPVPTLGSVARTMTLIIAAALVGAGAMAGLAHALLGRMPSGFDKEDTALILFLVFLLSFLVIAVPLAMLLIDWSDGRSSASEEKSVSPSPPASAASQPSSVASTAPAAAAAPTPAASPAPAETAAAPSPSPEPELAVSAPEPKPEAAPEEAKEPEPLDPIAGSAQAMIAPVPELPVGDAAKAAPDAPTAAAGAGGPPKPVPPPVNVQGLEEQKNTMVRFLSRLLGEVRNSRFSLDTYNRFGVDLMLAGGIEALGNHASIGAADKHAILQETIELMKTKSDVARKFTDKYEDYLVEPRYMIMVQAGRNAMESFLAGDDTAVAGITAVLETWNKPSATQVPPRIMTILFTDMVGSTDLTQSRGDQGAQEVLRRHNSIVRSALAEFTGKEIKHTGDGIMASFASAANGVEAAIAIQRAVAAFAKDHPDVPLRIRIGLDAGEPIEEEDDLFGTTVQLASRVCAQGSADQIMCTNVVRELSAGKSLDFVSRGQYELKGFKEKIGLYEVLWDTSTAEPVSREPVASAS